MQRPQNSAGIWDVYVMDWDDPATLHNVTEPFFPTLSSSTHAVWSLDGEGLFIAAHDGSLSDIWYLPLDGASPTNLTETPLINELYPAVAEVCSQAPSAVPEPVSVILFGCGLLGLGGYITRRRRSTQQRHAA